MVKLVFINGVMGVGKTTVSKQLYTKLDKSLWLDGDWCWVMNPFVVNKETKKMVVNNIVSQLQNAIDSKQFEQIIFSWVIDREELYETIISRLTGDFELIKITLLCSKETLAKRIEKDIQCNKRQKNNLERSLLKYDSYLKLESIKIYTDNKLIEEIVEEIKERVA